MADEAATSTAEPSTEAPAKSLEAPDWRASLSEELKGDPSLKDIGSLEDLAKGLVHAKMGP